MSPFFQFWLGFKEGLATFGLNIGSLVNFILLTVVYLVGVGPTAIIAKFLGKRFLALGFREKDSYWRKLSVDKRLKDSRYRQF
jgi:hypothetical protein